MGKLNVSGQLEQSKTTLRMVWNVADSLGMPNHSDDCSTLLRRVIWSLRPKLLTIFTTMLVLLNGCVSQDAAKTSHFEHDHEVAPHWPSDLADAAAKLRERLAWSESGRKPDDHDHGNHTSRDPGAEIADIVSWVPEIAADTYLSEQDWIPLDLAAESLSANLRAADNELTEPNRKQTIALCELMETSVTKIPGRLASCKDASP